MKGRKFEEKGKKVDVEGKEGGRESVGNGLGRRKGERTGKKKIKEKGVENK